MGTNLKIRKTSHRLPGWLLAGYALALVVFALAGAAGGILLGYEYNLPKIQSLEDYRPDVITDIYSDDEKVIGEFALERRIVVPYEEIPTYLQLAILAAEDDRFYRHAGVNYLGIARAAYRDIVAMRKSEGGSTITQQLARMLVLSTDKTFDRKIKELLITWKIESQYSKRQIFTLYCNQHYMGHGAYGVAAAADTYFGKQLKDLTLDECALIAGLPRNAGLYSPRLHPEAALARRNWVLDRMVREHMVSREMADEAKARPIVVRPRARLTEVAPYFIEHVRIALSDRYPTDVIWRKGLRVYTTLNIGMQAAASRALREGLLNYDKRHGWRGPIDNILKSPSSGLDTYMHPDWRSLLKPDDRVTGLVQSSGEKECVIRIGKYRATVGSAQIAWTRKKSPAQILKPGDLATFKIVSLDDAQGTAVVVLDQIPLVQGALLTLDNASGEIKALVGGYDFGASEFNRATQAMRQVGSTIKPIVYSTALEKGLDFDSTVDDSPVSFRGADGREWRPSNYDNKFRGEITLREALVDSRNVPTVKVASMIGIKDIIVMARRFGLSSPMDPYLPLAIGACEATPLEMAAAFSVFPNLGMQSETYFIRRIEDYDRVRLEEAAPKTRRVLPPEISGKMLTALQQVVQGGTAQAAKVLGRPVGGKTGTTNDFTDAWFVGFTPTLTTAVWVGFDTPKKLGSGEAGAVAALPIWIDYMQQVLENKPVEQFPQMVTTDKLLTGGSQPAPLPGKRLFIEELPAAGPAKMP